MTIDFFHIDYSFSFDEDLNMMGGYAKITAFIDDDLDEEIEIGHLSFNFYNTYAMDDDQELLFSADEISGDEEYMISAFIESDFIGGKVITLDQITIFEQYDQAGLEEQILEKFIDFCNYMNFDYILVIAANPRKDEDNEVIEFPLLKQYQELGFTKLGGFENRAPVMIKVLDEDEMFY
ncbi:hypothetical protein [Bacillus sp. REN16]|uniref:hypothetical protein n=1 Tax=Bacillus sp. REN16 TaxID=2887296 RepID=UPI001E5576E3|nr:hypothetical protein [Bacillus sp. REN16]MCC3356113.1 hypothetical protein [Bacillus sp. REN16]